MSRRCKRMNVPSEIDLSSNKWPWHKTWKSKGQIELFHSKQKRKLKKNLILQLINLLTYHPGNPFGANRVQQNRKRFHWNPNKTVWVNPLNSKGGHCIKHWSSSLIWMGGQCFISLQRTGNTIYLTRLYWLTL